MQFSASIDLLRYHLPYGNQKESLLYYHQVSTMLQSTATRGCTDLSPGTRDVEFRKKAKKEWEETQLNANIWERLPEYLIEEVLAKLPFASLFRLCCVCKRWRDSILSTSPHLAFFHAGKLFILNPSRNGWESIPMSFLPVDRLSSLSLVASAGGLLCFRTRSFGDFIICNPLTRSCKIVQMPWWEATIPGVDPVSIWCMPATLRTFHRSKSLPRFFLVGMVMNSDERHFKLIVASGVVCAQRTTLIYDSCSDSWERVAGLPEVGAGFHEAQSIAFRGNLYSTLRATDNHMKLLKFDVHQKTWSPIRVPQMSTLSWKLLEHNGKIVLMAGHPRNPAGSAFYELKDSGVSSWSSSKCLPLIRLSEAMGKVSENLKILECLGHGDSMFYIGSSNLKASRGGSSKLSFTVGVHNFSDNSDVLAGWDELQMGGCQSFPRFWQIFRPSLLPCA